MWPFKPSIRPEAPSPEIEALKRQIETLVAGHNQSMAHINNIHLQFNHELKAMQARIEQIAREVCANLENFKAANVRYSLVTAAMAQLAHTGGIKAMDQAKIIAMAEGLTDFVLTGQKPTPPRAGDAPAPGPLTVVPFSRQ